ncbi:unnamed protein product [Tenebrio molitor]|nr:unnamed protein product [Tenebrio molitor]
MAQNPPVFEVDNMVCNTLDGTIFVSNWDGCYDETSTR